MVSHILTYHQRSEPAAIKVVTQAEIKLGKSLSVLSSREALHNLQHIHDHWNGFPSRNTPVEYTAW